MFQHLSLMAQLMFSCSAHFSSMSHHFRSIYFRVDLTAEISWFSNSKMSEKTKEEFVIAINPARVRHVVPWTLWIVMTVVMVTFSVLCCISARNLHRLDIGQRTIADDLRPALIVSVYSAVVTLLFIGVSFLLTVGLPKMKAKSQTLLSLLVASLVHMFLMTFLCALVLHDFKHKVYYYTDNFKRWRYNSSGSDLDDFPSTFIATIVMGYLSAAMYLSYAMATFCIAVWFQQPQKTEEKQEDGVLLQDVS